MGNRRRRRVSLGEFPSNSISSSDSDSGGGGGDSGGTNIRREGKGGREDDNTMPERRRRWKKRGRLSSPFGVNSSNSTQGEVCFSCLTAVDAVGIKDEQESSVFSDFDVLNDAIQEFLLDSDDDDGDDSAIFNVIKPFLNGSRKTEGNRRKQTRKAVVTSPPEFALPNNIVLSGLTLAGAMLSGSNGQRCRRKRGTLLPCDKGLPLAPLCVVVDLDETLVSARRESVHLRPYVKELLDACHTEGCEVVVWSAGSPSHVNSIVRAVAKVSQRRNWYHHVISRHRKWYHDDGEGVKDLSVLGRPLNRVLMLENSPRSIQRQPQHSVLVEDYVQPTAHDESLRLLADLVRRLVAGLKGASDVASVGVPHLLSEDTTLVDLLIPLSPSTSKEGNISSRGLLYSPQAFFPHRSYGGRQPLVVYEES